MSIAYVQKIERGGIEKPGYNIVLQLAQALGVSASELIGADPALVGAAHDIAAERDTVAGLVRRVIEQLESADPAFHATARTMRLVEGVLSLLPTLPVEQQEHVAAIIRALAARTSPTEEPDVDGEARADVVGATVPTTC